MGYLEHGHLFMGNTVYIYVCVFVEMIYEH